MKFILSSYGSYGDLFPLLGIGIELKNRGHDVTFISHVPYQERIKAYGLNYYPLGTQEQIDGCINHPDLWNPYRAFGLIFNKMVAPTIEEQYRTVDQIYEPGHTIALINLYSVGALCFAEKHNMPTYTIHLQPSAMYSYLNPPKLKGLAGPRWFKNLMYDVGEKFVIDKAACPTLNKFRESVGLKPVQNITRWWHSKTGVLSLFPEWFATPQPDWPKPHWQFDFPLWNDGDEQELSGDILSFLDSGDPPILFTPGSANSSGTQFFDESLKLCKSLNRRGLFCTQYMETLPQNLPDSILHIDYAPYSKLLPRCSLLVHHGGVGTTAQGLAAGVPQLVTAFAHDQFDNGERVRKLNAGDWIDVKKYTASKTKPVFERLLSDRNVQETCRSIANQKIRTDGIDRITDFLESKC